MHRLLFLCDWLPPDFGAVGQYSVIAAAQRAAQGEDVVLAGLSSTADSEEQARLGAGRLRTIRLRVRGYDRTDLWARAIWTLRTNLALLWRTRRALARADEVLFTGSPPFLVHFLVPLNLLLRKRLVYRITDFHPECLMAEVAVRRGAARRRAPRGVAPAVGEPGAGVPWVLRVLYAVTVAMRRRVDAFEVLGEDQRERLRALGIPPERITLKRDPSPVEIRPGTRPLATPPRLAGLTVLLYSGNFGVAHDHETFVEGYRLHHRHGSGRVGLWLNATGSKADLVAQRLAGLGLPIARTRPLPLELLDRLLLAPAAHLITLRDEFVGYVLPSKVYGCLASGRGILFVGSRRSDVDRLCRDALAGEHYWQVAVGDPGGVWKALEVIAATASAAAALGAGAIPSRRSAAAGA